MARQRLFTRLLWISLSTLLLCVAVWAAKNAGWNPLGAQLDSSSKFAVETLKVGGVDRRFRVVFPQSADTSKRLPVVIALHGALDSIEDMARYSNLDASAQKHGFLLIYIEGRNLGWPPIIPPDNEEYIEPDLKLFDRVNELAVKEYAGDPRRIYLVGVSLGGCMVNLLVVNRSSKIAAAVCNCGWLPSPLGETPLETDYPCPMLFVVGDQDQQASPAMVLEARAAFEMAGHECELLLLPQKGHGWNQINEPMWEFLKGKTLEVPN